MCQIDGEDFVIFCGLLRKHELYQVMITLLVTQIIFLVFRLDLEFPFL